MPLVWDQVGHDEQSLRLRRQAEGFPQALTGTRRDPKTDDIDPIVYDMDLLTFATFPRQGIPLYRLGIRNDPMTEPGRDHVRITPSRHPLLVCIERPAAGNHPWRTGQPPEHRRQQIGQRQYTMNHDWPLAAQITPKTPCRPQQRKHLAGTGGTGIIAAIDRFDAHLLQFIVQVATSLQNEQTHIHAPFHHCGHQ